MTGRLAVFAVCLSGAALAWDGEDVYGPGQHADRYGRPFQFQTDDGQPVPGGVQVQPDGYGPGVRSSAVCGVVRAARRAVARGAGGRGAGAPPPPRPARRAGISTPTGQFLIF